MSGTEGNEVVPKQSDKVVGQDRDEQQRGGKVVAADLGCAHVGVTMKASCSVSKGSSVGYIGSCLATQCEISKGA